jgi:hypothetical protein
VGHGHVWERREMHTQFWKQNLKKRHHLEDLGVDRSIILKSTLKKMGGCELNVALDRNQWQVLVNLA